MPAMIKIFGERNTATNAVKAMIEANSASRLAPSVVGEVAPEWTGRLRIAAKLKLPDRYREAMVDRAFSGRGPLETWKHAVTFFDGVEAFSDCHVVFCVRHPASWALGLFRRPYHIPGPKAASLSEFLDKRWKTRGRERLSRREVSATELYNVKMAGFADLQERLAASGLGYSVVRQEDFAIDQEAVFVRLAPHLTQPAAAFHTLDASTKDKRKSRAYYEDYYGNQRWKDEIDPASSERLREEIDWGAVENLGYAPI